MCDRYPYLAPTKGGFVQFVPKLIVVTSNKPIEYWYKDPRIDIAPLVRRFEFIIEKRELLSYSFWKWGADGRYVPQNVPRFDPDHAGIPGQRDRCDVSSPAQSPVPISDRLSLPGEIIDFSFVPNLPFI
jgi:hypothetical protein